jgi:hypothetical protein
MSFSYVEMTKYITNNGDIHIIRYSITRYFSKMINLDVGNCSICEILYNLFLLKPV